MPVTSAVSADRQRIDIHVTERFDFSLHQEFRDTYRHRPAASEYRVDLAGTSYMDSSALGMLLLLREHATAHGAQVVLVGSGGGVQRVLTIANFDKLFRIEQRP